MDDDEEEKEEEEEGLSDAAINVVVWIHVPSSLMSARAYDMPV